MLIFLRGRVDASLEEDMVIATEKDGTSHWININEELDRMGESIDRTDEGLQRDQELIDYSMRMRDEIPALLVQVVS